MKEREKNSRRDRWTMMRVSNPHWRAVRIPIKHPGPGTVDIIRRAVSTITYSRTPAMIGHRANSPLSVAAVRALVCFLCVACCTSSEYVGRESPSSAASDRTSGNDFGPCNDGKCIKRTTQDITSGMWFGPRLGRRRRSERKSDVDPNTDLEALANILDGGRWAVITIPGGEKRQPMQFTPRLGRDSGEELFSYGFPKDQDELYAEEQYLPPLFAPRLGRRLPWTPSPRLGRQLHNIFNKPRQYSDDPRF